MRLLRLSPVTRAPALAPRSAVRAALAMAALALACAACDGPQSTLSPAGISAARIAALWWWMAGGALLIWALVVGLALYAARAHPEPGDERAARRLILYGGAVIPTVVLAALLSYGLALMPELTEPGPEGGVRIHVQGEEFWWRVVYDLQEPAGTVALSANEIRLPAGERVELTLTSNDVIHSFWIPSVAGKMDMIPGRTTRLGIEATDTGTYRGTCAEFCGEAHALMSFPVVVMEPDAFRGWVRARRAPARDPVEPIARRGRELFELLGCGACHRVGGTRAGGPVGPDLTHVGSRLTLGAGVLPNTVSGFERWIAATDEVKPGVHMPAFGMLPAEDLRALATYLEGLR